MSSRKTILFGSMFGFLSVVLGAFAAHALAGKLAVSALKTFQTGVQYQMFHALALLLIGVLLMQMSDLVQQKWLGQAAVAFVVGILLFSGSLYLLSLSSIKAIGIITPLGGLSFLFGWARLLTAFWKK